MWDYARIKADKSWNKLAMGLGYEVIKVGVADTGLDYTHIELTHKVADVVDFTTTEDPPICTYYLGGKPDAELAALYGGPADGDWNGHGTWIGGNIAAAMNYWDRLHRIRAPMVLHLPSISSRSRSRKTAARHTIPRSLIPLPTLPKMVLTLSVFRSAVISTAPVPSRI